MKPHTKKCEQESNKNENIRMNAGEGGTRRSKWERSKNMKYREKENYKITRNEMTQNTKRETLRDSSIYRDLFIFA